MPDPNATNEGGTEGGEKVDSASPYDHGSVAKQSRVDSASPYNHGSADCDELDGLTSAEQIKSILIRFVQAVNSRTFEITQLPWTRVAPDYTAVLHNPKEPIKSAQEIIDEQKHYISIAPDYDLKILDLEVTYLNEESGKATLFWNGETSGLYPDVKIYTTGTVEFRRIGTKWMASKFQGARGMRSSGEGTGVPMF
ncbi:hypothetical protein HII31_03545 [Pseudocercospora fuligena]|uniref:Uncharacterized protein n=1 Tax=Pseudocercospora fuligena TaxID=685502 RepID=A0A8H6RPZ8_9PEZI|nr:hypothetical protein HII31_03545 [Pseudocercospora fuligena]